MPQFTEINSVELYFLFQSKFYYTFLIYVREPEKGGPTDFLLY